MFPLKKSKLCYTNRKLRLTSGLKTSIKQRIRCTKMHRHPTVTNEGQYKSYKNKLNHTELPVGAKRDRREPN